MNSLEEKRIAMLAMIEDWRSSGKSKKQYCLEKGISEARFYYWYSRINEKESLSGIFSKEEKGSSGFTQVIPKGSTVQKIEVIYPNGVKVNVGSDLNLIARLIHLY